MKSLNLLSLTITLVVAFVANTNANEQNWYNFKVRFDLLPFNGFYDMPRTMEDAQNANWTPIDDGCKEGSTSKYPGVRMWHEVQDNEIILIFDANGYIAGTQSVVIKQLTDPSVYDFESSKMYNLETIRGQEVYLTTAYFVDPSIICEGRSYLSFHEEGTGYALHFQNGPTIDDLLTIPLTEEEMDSSDLSEWFKHKCFINMGDHYFAIDPSDPDRECKDIFPVQLIYDHQKPQRLAGFVWQHFAELPGTKWEQPDGKAVGAIVKNPPKCLLDQADRGRVRTLHHYFLSYVETCLF